MALARGMRLGPYEILAPLGAGGMGEVYRARDEALGRDVAIKVLAAARSRDAAALARFEREARAASGLNHPYIVHVYRIDAAVVDGEPVRYLAMELVEGDSLRARLRGGAGWAELSEPMGQVADAVAKAHAAGIVHRDLKPENVMISADGYAKVLDFGLAKLLEDAAGGDEVATPAVEGRTRTGMILGTPGYMSPEQVEGKAVDHRSDIFSFGCILYEVLTRQRPFPGDSAVATLHAIVYDQPRPVRELAPGIPIELERIVSRCLAKDPSQRFQAMRDVGAELRAADPRRPPRSGAVPTTAGTGAVVTGPPPRRALRRRVALAGLAVVLATIGVVLGRGRTRGSATGIPSPAAATIRIEKLTSRGNAMNPAISRDGRYVAYQTSEGSTFTLWLRDVGERTETPVVQRLSAASVREVAFSPDSRWIYYVVEPHQGMPALFRVPLIGGEPRLVHRGVTFDYGYDISPAGTISFFRTMGQGHQSLRAMEADGSGEREVADLPRGVAFEWMPGRERFLLTGERASLFMVDADGTGRRKVAELPEPLVSEWLAASPMGDRVLFVAEDPDQRLQFWDVDLTTGAIQRVGSRLWHRVFALEWLPDGRAFIVGEEPPGGRTMRLVSYPDGQEKAVPGDASAYDSLDLSADGERLVAAQRTGRSEVLVSASAGKAPFRRVLSGTDMKHTFGWTPDGKLVYASNEAGTYDLYASDLDGSPGKPLTFDRAADEVEPTVSPDGRYIVYASEREGRRGLVRINRDGTQPVPLTSPAPGRGDRTPQISPDGRWVVYVHWDNGPTLWKVPAEGGTPILIKGVRPLPASGVGEAAYGASWSPDGRRLAFFHFNFGREQTPIEIAVSNPDGEIEMSLPYFEPSPGRMGDRMRVEWSGDGSLLYFQNIQSQPRNLWRRRIAGGAPEQVTHFEDDVGFFDWSPDGKTLACAREANLTDVVLITGFR